MVARQKKQGIYVLFGKDEINDVEVAPRYFVVS